VIQVSDENKFPKMSNNIWFMNINVLIEMKDEPVQRKTKWSSSLHALHTTQSCALLLHSMMVRIVLQIVSVFTNENIITQCKSE
jgi:hypothetical protein